MSIRARMNAVFVTLMSGMLLVFVAAMILSAAPRIRAENDSLIRLSSAFAKTVIDSLHGVSDPSQRLAQLLRGLDTLRHITVTHDAGSSSVQDHSKRPLDQGTGRIPQWFTRLAHLEQRSLNIPVTVDGRNYGQLVITTNPSDEIAEIWDSIILFGASGLAIALTMLVLTTWIISRALAPMRALGQAVQQLQEGNYRVHVPETSVPEIADMCRKLSSLATALDRATSEKRQLAEKVLCIQDEERKDLARELHDELGPYLFSIRAGTAAMKTEVLKVSPNAETLAQMCESMLERIDAVQRTNRRVLHKLRPAGLDELGLVATLNALVAMWQKDHHNITVSLHVAGEMSDLDEPASLTVYRIVQEGLTNAFRHAGPTEVDVVIERLEDSNESGSQMIRVSVSDNGCGLDSKMKPGFGFVGMSERVWALGGTMELTNRPQGGLMLEAFVPTSVRT